MARINRKRRRNPLVLIGCEGSNESEQIYFSHFSERNCRITFSTGNRTDPYGILDDMKRYMDRNDIKAEYGDKIFLILDIDLSDSRINSIKSIQAECEK